MEKYILKYCRKGCVTIINNGGEELFSIVVAYESPVNDPELELKETYRQQFTNQYVYRLKS